MKRRWVVDTRVLAKCNDTDCVDCVDCTGFLHKLLIEGKLCLDPEEEIVTEYNRYIKPRSYLFWWWHKMIGQAGHLSYCSSKLSIKHKNRLVNDLGFHDDDIKFVGVATRSADKLLVSGDSDYNQAICEYLMNEFGVRVMTPDIALYH